ncbi:MAG TPA: MBL fold metallo-hydrolase [Candidatus Limnocylindrales bacterium]|jgi:glyoxylase-like metal-dependent hydrolase (beta-lactamase superfamily II)/rhodanese-related sulfurtransferase|nr:MBL fold metallo-hydrolase [Candidatus Limnocylindrales bacterium]
MDVELILTPGLGNGAFLVSAGREAVVVDPPRDAWRVIAVAEARGWRVTHVLETHVHNDYLSGALELHSAVGTEILAPARGRYGFAHRPMDDTDVLEIDGLQFTARATPGHTPEHLAWEVRTDGRDSPTAIATGGSLLVGSAGRTDLLGSGQTEALTRAQFHTLRSLAALPDDVAVLPTHGGGSFCSVGPADAARTTTIGRERRHNPLLTIDDESTFRTTLLDGLGPYPTYYAEMAPINRVGPAVVGRVPIPRKVGPDAVRAAVAGGAHVVDARSRRKFAAGHIGGSLNIELADSFASYVGWFVPFGAAVVLVLPDPFEETLVEAATQLFRIGYERIVGVLGGGVAAWVDAGGSLASYPVTTASTAAEEVARGQPIHMLDVRYPHEWRDDGAVPGAIEVSIGDLASRLYTLPRDAPITVMCKSGSRASIAASMLDAAGFDVRLVAAGGALDIADATG